MSNLRRAYHLIEDSTVTRTSLSRYFLAGEDLAGHLFEHSGLCFMRIQSLQKVTKLSLGQSQYDCLNSLNCSVPLGSTPLRIFGASVSKPVPQVLEWMFHFSIIESSNL